MVHLQDYVELQDAQYLVYEDQCYDSATYGSLRFMPFVHPPPAHPPDEPFSWRWTYLGTLRPEEREICTPTGRRLPIHPTPSFELKLGPYRFLVHEGAFIARLLKRNSKVKGKSGRGTTTMEYSWELLQEEKTVEGVYQLLQRLDEPSSSYRRIVLSCYGKDFTLAEHGSSSPRTEVAQPHPQARTSPRPRHSPEG